MAVDFVLDQHCRVKQAVGTEGLIQLIKSRSRGKTILEMARRQGDTRPPSEIQITVAVLTPDGAQDRRPVSVQSLLDQAAPLDELAPHCRACPANVRGPSFGCYGTINYPIQSRTERWLMSLLPEDLGCTTGFLLQSAVKDLNYDGSPIERLRSNPNFFEDRNPARRTWKGKGILGRFSGGFSLTSSQLLHMMFCVGPLQPPHCAMVSLFLGLLPHDSPGEVLKDKAVFEKAAEGMASRIHVPDGDAGAANFFHFFQAMVGAMLLDVPVLVDY